MRKNSSPCVATSSLLLVTTLFPAESAGGLKHLKNMAAPYKHLGITFLPLGGLNADNMKAYLESDLVAAIGGSWIAARNLIKAKDWNSIRKNAEEAMALAKA